MRKKKEPRIVPNKNERFKPPVHVGHLVWKHILYIEKQPKNNLAKQTNRSLTTITRQLRRDSLQTTILFEFCHALKRNFFEVLAEALPAEYSQKTIQAQAHIQKLENNLAQLSKENAELKTENKKLNERVDLLIHKL